MATGSEHIDTLLTNAVVGFEPRDLIVQDILPVVPVSKKTDLIPVWNKGDFFRLPDSTLRGEKTKGATVEFGVNSLQYLAKNYAITHERSFEEQANADVIFQSREKRARAIMNLLMLDWEVRVANIITSGSNLGSFTTLTGTSQWSDFANSDPVNDVQIGCEAVRATTGLMPNVAVCGKASYDKLVNHPDILDRIKHVQKGVVTADLLAELFGVEKFLVGKAVRNTADENATDSFTDVWSDTFVLLRTAPPDAQGVDPSFGWTMRWNSPELNNQPFAVERWNDPNGGNFENIRVMTYQDEKVTAAELGYAIVDTNA